MATAPVPEPEPQPELSTAAARRQDEERKTALRIIRNELRLLWRDPPPYLRPGPEPVTDPFHWEVVIDGPAGTPYAGGTFPVDIQLPAAGYPFVHPKVTFKTLVYHPNIDEEGNMVLDAESWSCATKLRGLLIGFVSVLYDPLLDYPINYDIAEQYAYDYERYEAEARAWTREFSSAPVVSHYPPNAVVGRTPPAVPHFPATAARRRAEAEARRRAAAAAASSGSGTKSEQNTVTISSLQSSTHRILKSNKNCRGEHGDEPDATDVAVSRAALTLGDVGRWGTLAISGYPR
uniref:Ubiquitin-conjugating enzyme 11 n=1 Tax=Oryza sativa subsp. japonica TaxID=39947 RepID=Q6Z665_ORYSJ|nr:putative ubiquitin-conjugating enzyme 11 [Oryza sativa Japonica Group]BAD13005.1 putative ubiquitin-conjugating enzyme 11 [Oryza sativa Japonica Group]